MTGLIEIVDKIFWQGKDISQIKPIYYQNIGLISHQNGIKEKLTVEDNLNYLFAQDQAFYEPEILQLLNLWHCKDSTAANLSFGQRKKIQLARLFNSGKKLWMLDEPLVGIDKETTQTIEKTLSSHLERNGMLIVTSHQPIYLHAKCKYLLEL